MITDFKTFVESSALTRFLANIFIFAILGVALAVVSYEILHGQQLNSYATTILGSGITYATTLLGVHFGAVTATGQPVPNPNATSITTEVKQS